MGHVPGVPVLCGAKESSNPVIVYMLHSVISQGVRINSH